MGKGECAVEKLLGVPELSKLLGLQKKTLHNWLGLNKFNLRNHLFKVGRSWRIDEEGYQALLDELKRENR